MEDEVKDKVVWTKGADFTDGSPRYTFDGRDPATTHERFQVVIFYTERERRYAHDPGSLCNHYYGYVRDDKMECAETIGPYYSVREAKQKTMELFNLFMQQYANQELGSTTLEVADHGHNDQQEHFQYQWAEGTPQRKYADIFNLYLAGETVDKISKMMQAENYDIPGKTISFSKGMVMNMLSNERYCGDAILQKSVTIDCIEKKRKKNTGEAPMYYVQNNHPAIIDRVTFNKVQEELARRKTKTPGSAKSSITSTGKYSRYALTDVLICGNCGTRYRRVTWSRNGTKRIVWRCISRLDYGKKYCSDSPTIMEDKLQEAIVRAVNKFNEQDNATYKALMKATISEALGLDGDPEEVDMLERKIEALNNKMLALVNESVISGEGIEAHESEFMTLSQETELLKQRIATIQESTARDNGEQNRLEQIQAIIAGRESKCMEYDDSIVRQMVECIKVYPGGKLEIIFGGGYLVEETV